MPFHNWPPGVLGVQLFVISNVCRQVTASLSVLLRLVESATQSRLSPQLIGVIAVQECLAFLRERPDICLICFQYPDAVEIIVLP